MSIKEILQKLATLANDLDTNGFYSEANEVDEIIRSAWGGVPNPESSDEEFARKTREQLQQFRTKHQKMQFPAAEITGKPLQHTRQKRRPDKRVMDFQNRYNTALQTLENMKIDISGVEPYLRVDGIEGPRTKSAYKSWATVRSLLQSAKGPSETEQRTGLTPQTMKQQKLQKTVDSHSVATGVYRQLMKQRPELATKWPIQNIRAAVEDMVQKGMTAEQAYAFLRKQFGLK